MSTIGIVGETGTAGMLLSSLVQSSPHLNLEPSPLGAHSHPSDLADWMCNLELVVLCVPEEAAREIALPVPSGTKCLDCSSTHRCDAAWTYGLPEFGDHQRKAIGEAFRVANPGCFAQAFLLLVHPLIHRGIISTNAQLSITGVTGYSAGGRKMIQRYESEFTPGQTTIFGLDLQHKHLAEMTQYAGLSIEPIFTPVVGMHREGLFVSVPLSESSGDIYQAYKDRYEAEPFIRIYKSAPKWISIPFTNQNFVDLYVSQEGNRRVVFAHLNNLMKGAAGTALQNINLMLGHDECAGLI